MESCRPDGCWGGEGQYWRRLVGVRQSLVKAGSQTEALNEWRCRWPGESIDLEAEQRLSDP